MTSIHRKIALAKEGNLLTAIGRLPSGWVVAGDVQPLVGYCVLLADPVVKDFNALSEAQRAQYGIDLGRIGDALLAVMGAYRVNYETWGNLDPALHTHVVPRYAKEPDSLRVQTPRQAYDWNQGRAFSVEQDQAWIEGVRDFLSPYFI